jgi:histidinol-phosphate aminotransferase
MEAPRERDAIAGLAPYEPGRPAIELERELGGLRVAKMASNEGQFGPFTSALRVIGDAAPGLNRYPESGGDLRDAIAARHGVEADRVALGNGADAVIGHLSMALLDAGDQIACCTPTFLSYRLAAAKLGASSTAVGLAGAAYDLEALAAAIGPRTRIVYVCNPNNPTGGIVRRDELAAFVEAVPERVLVVLDEAYHEYVEDPAYPDGVFEWGDRPNVCVLRTFSKMYGLAGLRVGYAVAPPGVARAVAKVRPPFDVNELAHVAALASLDDSDEVARRRALTVAGREGLREAFAGLGLDALDAHGNFLCVQVGDGRAVAARLEAEGVIVRPLDRFGDPGSIRVTVGTAEENERCAAALGRVLEVVR